jgi:hypothetical protein
LLGGLCSIPPERGRTHFRVDLAARVGNAMR